MKRIGAELTLLQRHWIAAVLANDETSTDQELIDWFVENLVKRETAEYIVKNLRSQFLH